MTEKEIFLPRDNKLDSDYRIAYGDGPTHEEIQRLRTKLLIQARILVATQEVVRLFNPFRFLYMYTDFNMEIDRVQKLTSADLIEIKKNQTLRRLNKVRD